MDPPAPAPLSQTPPIAAADSALVKSAVDAAAQSPDSGGGDLLTITASVCGVFLVIMIGAFCRRRQWLTRQADRSLANLTANVLLPALFFSKILGDERLGQGLASLVDVGQAPVIGFAVTAIGFLLAFGFARLVGPTIGLRDDASQRSFAICAGICNYGYIPLPLAQQFYPAAEVTLILHNVGVDIALWSVGLMIVSGGSPTESPATGRPTSDDDDSVESTSEESRPVKTPWWRALISPPMLAVVIALAIKATGITAWVPAPITSAATLMGACTIPMGLLLSGAIMIDCLKEADWSTGRGTILSALLLRLGLFPILMLGFGVIAISSLEMRQVMMLEAAMPAAIFPIILVRLYDKDTTTALHVVLSTSFIGIITIPMWLGIGSWWLGV